MIEETHSFQKYPEKQGAGCACSCGGTGEGISHAYETLRIYLIKPSKYDDDGYVIRHWKGVLPSNTLACLYGLTEDVRERGVLGQGLRWEVIPIDDTVERVDVKKIVKAGRKPRTKTLICLAGVQTNQFLRASHLAYAFRRHYLDVLIGGFHVSGVIATLSEMPQHLVDLQKAGVKFVAGEVEGGRWEMILKDALQDRLKPVYNFLGNVPDLSDAPLPRVHKKFLNRYAVTHFTTLDCGRGCPFGCSFCTVINVQGRKMRFRSADAVIRAIRENYFKHNISTYFFTDDNFCRNKNWEELFDAFTRIRQEDKIPLHFMIQVDTKSHHVPNFVEKASKASCSQVFIGMESINDENLKSVGKTQNDIEDYKRLVDAYQNLGIVAHLAYIIGFPFDTRESVMKDLQKLMELGAGQASFFMMTPLPGAMDYKHTLERKTVLDADLNNFDSFHETHRHARMKAGEWQEVYEEAWKKFCSVENMKHVLHKVNPKNYWGVFLNFVWYKNAVQVEGGHPMLHGFVRLKGRHERRPDYPLESRWVYFKRRSRDLWWTLTGWLKLVLEMEEVWLATRHRSALEKRVAVDFAELQRRVHDWRSMGGRDIQAFYRRAALQLSAAAAAQKKHIRIKIPTRFQLWWRRQNIFSASMTFTRFPMKQFWKKAKFQLKQGDIFRINYVGAVRHGLHEIFLFFRFLFSFLKRSLPITHQEYKIKVKETDRVESLSR